MGSFVFRWPYPAKDVHVTGTFDDWGKTEALNQVGDHWEKEVQLPFADKKIMYKFVVDDQWIVDENAPKEDDGHNNVNNVLLPEQIKKTESSVTEPPASPGHRVIAYSSSPPGTNAEGASADAPTFSAPQNGAPTLTRSESEANAARWVPHVAADPDRPVTRELSSSDIPGGFPETPAAESDQMKVDPLPASGHANTQTSVTTSKEDYENAGGEGTAATGLGVAPLPASGHSDIQSSITTSKEDYDNAGGEGAAAGFVSAQPIPATGHEDIQSSVTTTKEEYEKAGLVAAAGAAATGAGIALKSAFSKPSGDDKNIIPESSLPMNPEKTDTLDAGPFVSSSGPGTTTADLAAKVPLEPKREAQIVDDSSTTPFLNSSGPGTTTADLASHVPLAQARQGLETGAATDANVATGVPDVVKESIQAAHASPEAAASPEIVAEKSALEKELASKVTPSQATGEPASASAQQTSYYGLATSVPAPVEESMKAAHASPEAAADASAVAEKSALERELAAKVPVAEGAGEPAPTIAAATSTAAPAATSPSTSAAAAATSITDGTTANEPLPGTDTSTTSTGPVAGAIAGGAVVAGSAAAAATVAAHRHEDGDAEPSRVADSAKPDVTNDLAKDQTKVSGIAPSAAAQVSDGADASDVEVPRTTAPVEKTEATATEYAPPREASAQPGVSRTAPAAMLDGTEDPTLMEEPAVQMMAQNDKEDVTATGAPVHDATTTNATDTAPAAAAATSSSIAAPATPKKEATTTTPATTETPKKDTPATPSKNTTASPAGASTTSTPAKNGTPSRTDSTTEDGKKKKRHRISAMFKKIFD